MAKTFRSMPSINGVGASQTATLNMPIGLTYHGLLFTMGGTTMAITNIDEIRINGNGRNIYTVDGGNLDEINLYEGQAGASGTQFYLDFERYGLESQLFRELTAIGTGFAVGENNPTPLSTFQAEIDIDGSASAPTLSAKALQSAPKPLGLLKKRRIFTYSPAGALDFEISDLPKGDLIDKIMIRSANNAITQVRVDRDNFRMFDRTPDENDLFQINGVRVPQDNWFVVDPSERGVGGEAFVTSRINDFRLIITVSAADTLTIYVDYIGGLQGN